MINSFELFEGRELWIGADGQGLFRFDLLTEKLQRLACSDKSLASKVFDLHKVEGDIQVLNDIDGICSANRQFEFIPGRLDNIQAVFGRFQEPAVGGYPGRVATTYQRATAPTRPN